MMRGACTRGTVAAGMFAIGALTGCRGVEWVERAEDREISWRGRQIHRTEHDLILALDESSAADAARGLEELRARCAAAGVDPGPGLVLALGYEDPLPVGDPDRWLPALARAHMDATGIHMDAAVGMQRPPDGECSEEQAARFDAVQRRTMCSAIDVAELGVPESITADRAWAVVWPTDACLDAAASESFALMMEVEQPSFTERVLMAPFVGMARSRVSAMLAAVRTQRIGQEIVGRDADSERQRRVVEALLEEDTELLGGEMLRALVDPGGGSVSEDERLQALQELRNDPSVTLVEHTPMVAIAAGTSTSVTRVRDAGFELSIQLFLHDAPDGETIDTVVRRMDASLARHTTILVMAQSPVGVALIDTVLEREPSVFDRPRSMYVTCEQGGHAAEFAWRLLAALARRAGDEPPDEELVALWRAMGQDGRPPSDR